MIEIKVNQNDALQRSVDRVEDQVEELEQKAGEIPQPAGGDVLGRLETLASDKDDLVARFERLKSGAAASGSEREELKILGARLRTEAEALGHEADFLSMGARTTLDLILEAATRVADAVRDRTPGSDA